MTRQSAAEAATCVATARLNSTLRGAAGRQTIQLDLPEGATVAVAIQRLAVVLPALAPQLVTPEGGLSDNIVVFRDGRNIRLLNGLETPVSTGQTLDFFPKIGAYRVFGSGQLPG